MNLQLETKRLLVRPLEISDAQAFFKMDNNPNVHKYLWQKPVLTIDETLSTIKSVQDQYVNHKIGRFAAVLKSTNEFIGWVGIKFNTDIVNNKTNFYDIGYRLDEPFWGQGYATEASFAWLDYGFQIMKIQNMEAAAHIDNVASNKILDKIGMTNTGSYHEDAVEWNWFEMKNPAL